MGRDRAEWHLTSALRILSASKSRCRTHRAYFHAQKCLGLVMHMYPRRSVRLLDNYHDSTYAALEYSHTTPRGVDRHQVKNGSLD
jgi:hypothetical protein